MEMHDGPRDLETAFGAVAVVMAVGGVAVAGLGPGIGFEEEAAEGDQQWQAVFWTSCAPAIASVVSLQAPEAEESR